MEGFNPFAYWQTITATPRKKMRIYKYRKSVRGEMRYFYERLNHRGETIYKSAGFGTRGGRNKAVNRLILEEDVDVIFISKK